MTSGEVAADLRVGKESGLDHMLRIPERPVPCYSWIRGERESGKALRGRVYFRSASRWIIHTYCEISLASRKMDSEAVGLGKKVGRRAHTASHTSGPVLKHQSGWNATSHCKMKDLEHLLHFGRRKCKDLIRFGNQNSLTECSPLNE
jgi:hypothetical protein